MGITISEAYAEMGRLGGMSRTPRKAAASRLNGRKGGRPRKNPSVDALWKELRSYGPEPVLDKVAPYTIHTGNVLDVLPTLPDNYFNGMLSDPPYELGFMNKGWDSSGIAFNPLVWSEVYRVMAPGSYILAFGGSRTHHRLMVAIEDAGFQIRDCLFYLYGTGFPKGRGCLKPSYEPIVLARKPIGKVQPLNIDACRINPGDKVPGGTSNFSTWVHTTEERKSALVPTTPKQGHNLGRWPANIILDDEAAAELGDSSRYFYTSKPSRKERDAGCEHIHTGIGREYHVGGGRLPAKPGNPHIAVKPLDLCRWLATLIRPTEPSRLLVPFSGSGSEMIGSLQAGWDEVVGIELDPQYVRVAEARIRYWSPKS